MLVSERGSQSRPRTATPPPAPRPATVAISSSNPVPDRAEVPTANIASAAAADRELARIFKAMRQRVAGAAGAGGAIDSLVRSPQRRITNRRRICCSAAARRRAFAWMPWAFVAIAMGCGMFPGSLQGLGEAVAAVSSITQAAGSVLSAGANASIAVSTIAVDALATSVSAVDEVWRGVDVLNVSLHRSAGKAVAHTAADLCMHLLTQGQIPHRAQKALVRSLANTSSAVPIVVRQDDYFNVGGEYTVWWLAARVRNDKSLAAAYWVINVTFQAQWANPAWDILGFRIETESARIVEGLSRVFMRLPALPDAVLAIDEIALATEFGSTFTSDPNNSGFPSGAGLAALGLCLGAGLVLWGRPRGSPIVEQPLDELGFEATAARAANQDPEYVQLGCSSPANDD